MKETYERTVHPLPNEREWTILESLEQIVWPPKSRKPAERPRKKRIRSKGKPKVTLKCTRCGKVGHNRRTCNNLQLYKPPKQNNKNKESKKKD
ncbi:hypothetical protein CsatB_009119 [Cannabis sativa]